MSGYLSALRSANRNLIWYLAGAVGFFAHMGNFDTLFNLYLLERGFGEQILGTLMVMLAVSAAVSALSIGLFGGNVPRHHLMIGGAAASLLGFLLMLWSPNLLVLYAGRAVSGAAMPAFWGIGLAYIADQTDPKHRAYWYSLTAVLVPLVVMISQVTSGYLAGAFGGGEEGLRAGLYLSVVVLTLHLAAFSRLQGPVDDAGDAAGPARPQPARLEMEAAAGGGTAGADAGRRRWGNPLRALVAKLDHPREVLLFVLILALTASARAIFEPYLNVIFDRRYGVAVHDLGWFLGAQTGAMVVGTFVAPMIAGRRFVSTTLVLRLLAIPFTLALVVALQPVLFTALAMMRGTLIHMTIPLIHTFQMNLLTTRERSTAGVLSEIGVQIGIGLTGPLAGFFLARSQFEALFWLSAFFGVVFVIVYRRWFGPLEQREADREAAREVIQPQAAPVTPAAQPPNAPPGLDKGLPRS